MIIWSGIGFLPVVCIIVFGFLFYDSNPATRGSDAPIAYAMILTGIVTGVVGYLLRRRPERVLVDKVTGQEVKFHASHSLFFIPMVYWGPIFLVWGLILLIRGH